MTLTPNIKLCAAKKMQKCKNAKNMYFHVVRTKAKEFHPDKHANALPEEQARSVGEILPLKSCW